MIALSIASGNPLMGAVILSAFVIGTFPLFFAFGYFATRLGDAMQKRFLTVAAIIILLLSVYNTSNLIVLSGASMSFTSATSTSPSPLTLATPVPMAEKEVTMYIEEKGYSPKNIILPANAKIKLNLVNTTGQGCTQSFVIPSFRIQRVVPLGRSETIEFNTPKMSGQLAFMCGMGMYRGQFFIS